MPAKKSLGQNFLHDEDVLHRILAEAHLSQNDTVVEIGAGTGFLTQGLSQKAGRIFAFEIDDDLIPGLLRKFPIRSNVSIIHQDILQTDMAEMLASTNYKVVANIPYYITAPIVRYFMEMRHAPSEMILMMQKEVAERITEKPGAMSVLGIAVQYYADAEILFTVPKTAFDPIPKVESAVVRMILKRHYDILRDKEFFRLVKVGFSSRRKTLVNNLASGLLVSKDDVIEKLAKSRLHPSVRAQELSIAEWERLRDVWKEC